MNRQINPAIAQLLLDFPDKQSIAADMGQRLCGKITFCMDDHLFKTAGRKLFLQHFNHTVTLCQCQL